MFILIEDYRGNELIVNRDNIVSVHQHGDKLRIKTVKGTTVLVNSEMSEFLDLLNEGVDDGTS